VASDRQTYRIGFWVLVDAEGADAHDAIVAANGACGWPGDFQPPLRPIEHTGSVNRQPVTAKVIRSEALMVKETDRG